MNNRRSKMILSFVLVFSILTAVFPVINANTAPARSIYIVYDDSSSMYKVPGTGEKVDTWCQAKYAMEVFVAMMGKDDSMKIYYMSDYENKKPDAEARITLNGSDSAQDNVDIIHNEQTDAHNTNYATLVKAIEDIKKDPGDDKWLVILTDGLFEDDEKYLKIIDSDLEKLDSRTSVAFLGMGKDAYLITNRPDNNIFVSKAENNNIIRKEVTDICNRIFNTNRVNVQNKSFSIDIPMKELTVFVQGQDIQLNGIKPDGGALIRNTSDPVKVRYSECDAKNQNNAPNKDLNGCIAVYDGDFAPGTYTVDAQGADVVEVYYKPNIDICVDLIDSKGNKVTDVDNIETGEYTLDFGFVKSGTDERVNENSPLLGTVEFDSTVIVNGVQLPGNYTDGSKISLDEGDIAIDANATYLDYNTVQTHIRYGVFKNRMVTFKIEEDPQYTVDSSGITNPDDSIFVRVYIEGETPTLEKWGTMAIPDVDIDSSFIVPKLVDQPRRIDDIKIEKTEEPGLYKMTPVIDGKPGPGTYSDTGYVLSYSQSVGIDKEEGGLKGVVKVNDTRPWWERNWDIFIKLAILGLILMLIIGYLPFVKPYLPKGLKKKPYIRTTYEEPGIQPKDGHGKFEKNIASTLIPYVAQKGTIKILPAGATGAPRMAVKAVRGNRMILTNQKAYTNKEVTFDGTPIKKDTNEKLRLGAGTTVITKRNGAKHVCSLSKDRK